MTTGLTKVLGAAAAVAALAGLGALSRFSYVTEKTSHGLVRLALRTSGTRVRECRHRTAEEMAKLPVHMREGEVCERKVLPYLLTVAVDELRDSALVHASGVQQDRPLYVYREIPVAPGSHRVQVVFERQGKPAEEAAHDEQNEPPHGEPAEAQSTPARLALDTLVTLEDRAVVLVTYDRDSQRLVIHTRTF